MVKTQHQLTFSPTVLVAITVAFLVYSGLLSVTNNNTFHSILSNQSIISMNATISTNPTKTQSKNYYSAQAKVHTVYAKDSFSEAKGMVQLLLSSYIVEALYPGKLFSKAYATLEDTSPIIEKGINAFFSGYFIEDDANHDAPVFIVKSIHEIGWEHEISYFRAVCRLEFKRLLYAWGDAGGLLLALISGSREYTNENLAQGFKNAGLSHILALSGMHLSIFAGLALSSGKLISKRTGTIFSLFAVFLFVWFAGLSPSLFRALLCTLVALALQFCSLPGIMGNGEVLFRFINPSYTSMRLIRILSFSFLIHICIFPHDIFSAAFKLSYGALVGIALAEYFVKPALVRILPSIFASPLSAAIGAQICTAPITIHLFGTIMPIGIISSVVVSPLVLCFFVLGFFCIIISLAIPYLLYGFGDIIQLMYQVLESVVLWFSQFPSIHF